MRALTVSITISDEFYQGLQELAEKDKRTLSKEIEYLLEYCVTNKPHLQRFPFIVAEPAVIPRDNSFFTSVDLGEGKPV